MSDKPSLNRVASGVKAAGFLSRMFGKSSKSLLETKPAAAPVPAPAAAPAAAAKPVSPTNASAKQAPSRMDSARSVGSHKSGSSRGRGKKSSGPGSAASEDSDAESLSTAASDLSGPEDDQWASDQEDEPGAAGKTQVVAPEKQGTERILFKPSADTGKSKDKHKDKSDQKTVDGVDFAKLDPKMVKEIEKERKRQRELQEKEAKAKAEAERKAKEKAEQDAAKSLKKGNSFMSLIRKRDGESALEAVPENKKAAQQQAQQPQLQTQGSKSGLFARLASGLSRNNSDRKIQSELDLGSPRAEAQKVTAAAAVSAAATLNLKPTTTVDDGFDPQFPMSRYRSLSQPVQSKAATTAGILSPRGPSSIPAPSGDAAYAKTSLKALLSDSLPRVEFPALLRAAASHGGRDLSGVMTNGPLSPRAPAAPTNAAKQPAQDSTAVSAAVQQESSTDNALVQSLGGVAALARATKEGLSVDDLIRIEVQGVLSDVVNAVAFEHERGARPWADSVQALRKQKAREQAIRIQTYFEELKRREMGFKDQQDTASQTEVQRMLEREMKLLNYEEKAQARAKLEEQSAHELGALLHLAHAYQLEAMQKERERHLRSAMREQERLYELKSMRLFRMRELEPFLREAQEAVLRETSIFKSEQEAYKKARLARALALANSIRAQKAVEEGDGAATQVSEEHKLSVQKETDIHAQAIAIEHRVRQDQQALKEAEVELERARAELKMIEESESESEMEIERRLGRKLSTAERQNKTERSAARARARAHARRRIAELTELQFRKHAEQVYLAQSKQRKEEEARMVLLEKREKEQVVRTREEDRRAAAEAKKREEEEAVQGAMEAILWEVTKDERIENECAACLQRMVTRVEKLEVWREIGELMEDMVVVVEQVDNERQVRRCLAEMKDTIEREAVVEETVRDLVLTVEAQTLLNEVTDAMTRQTAEQTLKDERNDWLGVVETVEKLVAGVEAQDQWERRFKNFKMKRDMMRVARVNKLIRFGVIRWLTTTRQNILKRRQDQEKARRDKENARREAERKAAEENQRIMNEIRPCMDMLIRYVEMDYAEYMRLPETVRKAMQPQVKVPPKKSPIEESGKNAPRPSSRVDLDAEDGDDSGFVLTSPNLMTAYAEQSKAKAAALAAKLAAAEEPVTLPPAAVTVAAAPTSSSGVPVKSALKSKSPAPAAAAAAPADAAPAEKSEKKKKKRSKSKDKSGKSKSSGKKSKSKSKSPGKSKSSKGKSKSSAKAAPVAEPVIEEEIAFPSSVFEAREAAARRKQMEQERQNKVNDDNAKREKRLKQEAEKQMKEQSERKMSQNQRWDTLVRAAELGEASVADLMLATQDNDESMSLFRPTDYDTKALRARLRAASPKPPPRRVQRVEEAEEDEACVVM